MVKLLRGNLDYYNKDNSDMRTVEVPLYYTEEAIKWWTQTKKSHEGGLPPLRQGENPSATWECNYCEWKDCCTGFE